MTISFLPRCRQLTHPRLLRFIGATIIPQAGKVGIVLEFMERGSLEGLLWEKKDNSIRLSWSSKMQILCDIAEGMAYIHSEGFIHRDLKSPNVLIGDGLRAKVADFGLARTQNRAKAKMTKVGTPLWLAPEIFTKDGHYDSKCDVFSFGIIMNEVLTEKQPYYHIENAETIMQRVFQDPSFRPIIPSVAQVKENHPTSSERRAIDNVFMSFQWLMCACWDSEPTKRPTFSEVVSQLKNMSQIF